MVTANFMGNKIGKEQLAKLQEMMKAHPTLVSLCGIADDATEADLSGLGMSADDAAVLADELPAKGALTSLNMSKNAMLTKEAGKALGDMLKANSVLKELDVSSNYNYDAGSTDGAGFASGIADGVSTNGALTTIIFGDKQAVTMKADMTEADLSGKQLGASGAIIAAAFLPKCQ